MRGDASRQHAVCESLSRGSFRSARSVVTLEPMPTIMYVDDDALVRSTVRRMLERQGITVETAEGVGDAERRLADRAVERTVDGIFIDIWLGDGTAFDLYAWLQEHQPALAKRAAFVTVDVAD